MLSREEEFVTVTKHAVTIHIKSGVRRDGSLTARQIEAYWNVGAYASSSRYLTVAGMLRSIGPYRVPNVQVDSYGVYTNLPPAAAYRGAMSSQGAWAHESHMDSIARRLGMDPLEFRLRNILREGDTFATGETVHDVHFERCLQAVAQPIGWGQPFEREPAPHRRRGRGLAVMMKHTLSTSRSECALELDRAGRLTLYTSSVEMGQGAHTALAQICAQELGVPAAVIRVQGPDTAVSPYDAQTASSRTAFMMGNAVREAANALQRQLIELAAPLLGGPADRLAAGQGAVFVESSPLLGQSAERLPAGRSTAFTGAAPGMRLSYAEVLRRSGLQSLRAEGSFQTEGGLDPETGQGLATPHWHQGAGACEVEVDLDTGKVSVLRYYASAFAGKVINPELARLQNDGNVIYGLGPTFMEEMLVDSGQVLNANLSDYRIPSFLDLPGELGSVLLESEGSQIHGLGEMTLPPVAPAIANAVYDAVGLRLYRLPITAEKVFRALVERRDER
jgi:CO/xanthine dehydrogenase Mo-binding subunit